MQKYIPEWQDYDDHITIRHLLTHTSGLRDAFALLGWTEPSESAGDYNEAIVRVLARQRGLNFPPGSEYQYNNGGYNLLASILKRATGQSLSEFAGTNIFRPLGMTHTHLHDDLPMLVPNRASGYSRNASGWRAAKEDGGVVGNTGMYSTVGDLLRWEDNFDNPSVGTPEMFATMEKTTTLPGGMTVPSGLGVAQYRGLRFIGHSGGDHGIATNLRGYPDQRFAGAVLCNIDHISMGGTTTIDPEALANSIADIYFADALGTAEAAGQTIPPPTAVKLSDVELAEKTGLYRAVANDRPALLSVDHGTLMLRSYYQDDFDFELTPVPANRFLLQGRVPFEFVPATAGQPKEWHYGEVKNQRVMQLVTFSPPATEVRSYSGTYRSDELGLTYTLEARDSMLVVKATGRPDITIAPFSKDVFVGDWVGIVKFSRDMRGAITGFTVNRDIARGVWFDRLKRSR